MPRVAQVAECSAERYGSVMCRMLWRVACGVWVGWFVNVLCCVCGSGEQRHGRAVHVAVEHVNAYHT